MAQCISKDWQVYAAVTTNPQKISSLKQKLIFCLRYNTHSSTAGTAHCHRSEIRLTKAPFLHMSLNGRKRDRTAYVSSFKGYFFCSCLTGYGHAKSSQPGATLSLRGHLAVCGGNIWSQLDTTGHLVAKGHGCC